MSRTFVIVASLDHVQAAVAGEFIQAGHGKRSPMNRLDRGDVIICYASKVSFGKPAPHQRFAALGTVMDDEAYVGEKMGGLPAFRRAVRYAELPHEAEVRPLLERLSFVPKPRHWGLPFRRGFFEINTEDAGVIISALGTEPPPPADG